MDVTLIVNGLDLSGKLSTYSVTDEVTYKKVITTLDGSEHPSGGTARPVVTFSLLPLTDEETAELYNKLSTFIFPATFTRHGKDEQRNVRVVSNLSTTFLLRSVDGKRRYKGSEITLRGL